MNIIIMRHGAAIYKGVDRVLSEEGRVQVATTACKINSLFNITKIYSSPKSRAKETAGIVQAKMRNKINHIDVLDELSPAGNASLAIDSILASANDEDNILLVSHIPIVSELVCSLNNTLMVPMFDTANAYVIHIENHKFRPFAFITPQFEKFFS